MFERLKQHWKVNNKDLFLILCTFAVTGTLTAIISRQITIWLDVERLSFLWWALKIIVLILGYQVIILVVGFCFGMFRFFWRYEKKILLRMGIKIRESNREVDNMHQPLIIKGQLQNNKIETQHIAIFASGTGSNAQKIIEYFRLSSNFSEKRTIKIALIVCNNSTAGVLQISKKEKIPSLIIEKKRFHTDGYLNEFKKYNINFIVLAGFMWKVPQLLINAYPSKIINIHPALLPKFGGKNMYGNFVHEAVINSGERESGITIHYVDELYDHGKIIFQAKCALEEGESVRSLAEKVHALEHANYARIIEEIMIGHLTTKTF